jgi:hypothetical protein
VPAPRIESAFPLVRQVKAPSIQRAAIGGADDFLGDRMSIFTTTLPSSHSRDGIYKMSVGILKMRLPIILNATEN